MLELILIALAWRKGWRWKALLPPLISFALIIVVASAAGESGDSFMAFVIPVAIGELVALGVMASRSPQDIKVTPETQMGSVSVAHSEESSGHHRI